MSKLTIVIALYKGNGKDGIKDKAIKMWTKSKYSHVELILPNGTMIGSLPNVGIRATSDYNLSEYDLYPIEVTQAQVAIILNIFLEENGCKYDWEGIFLSQIVSFHRQSSNKWFCSEFMAYILMAIKVMPDVGMDPARFSPEDIYKFILTRGTDGKVD